MIDLSSPDWCGGVDLALTVLIPPQCHLLASEARAL